jgi:polysaccharide deacetylase 2 family uncharacterized protein YibQ
MNRPTWVSTDPAKAILAAERALSPRLEAALRTDVALDVLATSHAVRRLLGRAADRAVNGAVEAVGLPSSRQLRRLQTSLDELARSRA